MSRTRWDRRHAHPDDRKDARVLALGGDLKTARETGAASTLRFALRERRPDLFDNHELRDRLEKKPRGPKGQLSRTQRRRLGETVL